MNIQRYSVQNIRNVTNRAKRKKSFYHEQLKPIIIALKLFGALPFTSCKKGPAFVFTSWTTLYSFSIFSITVACVGFFWYTSYSYTFLWLTMSCFLYRLAFLCCSILAFSIPMFWINIKGILEYWDRWKLFQDKFESCTFMPLQINITRRVWAVTVIPTAILALNLMISVFTYEEWYPSNVFLYNLVFGFMNLSTGYFYLNCYMFRKISMDINQRIMDIIWKKKSTAKFKQHVELWCLMSQLMMDFGTVHGGIYCSTAIILYLSSIIILFGVFKILLSAEKIMSPTFIMPAVFTSSVLFVYSEAAHLAFSEVGPKLQRKVLNSIIFGLEDQMKHEVQDFLEIIKFFRPNMSLCGFCVVNRQFFIDYTFAVFFNIIIAFQLQIVPKHFDVIA